ncbi:MAG: hypothetical protein AAF525_10280 [Pseudomonadota bacterium]
MTKALRHKIAFCLASIGLSVSSVLSASDAVLPGPEPLVVTRPVSEQDGLSREFQDDSTIPDTETAIADITRLEGRFSYTLVDPLTHQYEAAIEAGDLAVARETLLAIQHLIHREYGVLAPRQRSVLEKLANVQLRSRQADEADNTYRLSHYIAMRQHEDDWSFIAPELQSLIEWQITTGQFSRARRSLRDATDRAEGEGDTYSLANFMIQSAQLREFSWYCCSRKYINRAIDLLETLPDDPDTAPLHTQIADLLVAENDIKGAQYHYERANRLKANEDYSKPQPLPGKYILPYRINDSLPAFSVIERNDVTNRTNTTNRSENSRRTVVPDRSSPIPPDLDPAMVWETQIQAGQPPKVARLLADPTAGGVVLNRNRQDPTSSRQVYFVGAPIEFVESQIYFALPRSQKNADALTNMSLSFRINVTRDGRVRDITAIGDARRSPLYNTVRRALRVLRFRPALVNGRPVDQILEFTQTFPPVLAPRKKDRENSNTSRSPDVQTSAATTDRAPG